MRVAIADDRIDEREILKVELEEAGHQTVPREAPLPTLDDLVGWLQGQEAEAFVCDQRLSYSHYATFQGAQAISHVLDQLQLPSLLVSSYITTDRMEILRWRASVPVLIEKVQLGPEKINRGFDLCKSELEGNVPLQRILRRTGLHVENVYMQGSDQIVEAIAPGWNWRSAVKFPLDVIENDSLMEDVRKRQVDWLIAKVNVDAESVDELFFKDFERAPNPEGLGRQYAA